MFMRRYLDEIFYLDLRSLALFRIGLGWTVIYNVLTWLPNIDAFLGPRGVYPLAVYNEHQPLYLHWSVFALSDHHWFLVALFAFFGLCGAMLALGWHTRMACIACWAMIVSLVNRNPAVAFGGDYSLITLLLWAIFLPLGERFSLDARLNPVQMVSNRIRSVGSLGLVLQMAIIYVAAGWSKSGPAWATNSALYYIFNDVHFAKPLGIILRHHHFLLQALTQATLYIERYAVLLLFVPGPVARSVLVGVFCIFHLVIDCSMNVGWFSLIMIVGWAAFIPSAWWKTRREARGTNKQVFGRREPWMGSIAAVVLVCILAWNIVWAQNSVFRLKVQVPPALTYAPAFSFNQGWAMFSKPRLLNKSYYFLPVFETEDALPQDYEAYTALLDRYQFTLINKDFRWYRLIFCIAGGDFGETIAPFSEYLTDYWNGKYPQGPKLKSVQICYWDEKITPYTDRLLTVDPQLKCYVPQ